MLNLTIINNSNVYDMIYDLNCWVKNYYIGNAEPKTYMIDVPNRNGLLDLSEVFGKMTYNSRKLRFDMIIVDSNPIDVYNNINQLFNGKKCELKLEQDPDYYYEGYITIGDLTTNKSRWLFSISAVTDPYKYKVAKTVYNVDATAGGTSFICKNSKMDVFPSFLSNSNVTVDFGDVSHTLTSNTKTIFNDIMFSEGDNEITLTGTGTVEIAYKEGIL